MTFRAFSIGFSAGLLALACGGGDSNNDEPNDNPGGETVTQPPAPPLPVPTPTDDCAANPLDLSCQEPVAPQPGNPQPQPGNEADLETARISALLVENCGQCHGPALTLEQAQAGMNFIDDLQRLAEAGQIVPGNAEGSEIIKRMRSGAMPPGNLPKVPVTDIDAIADYINNPTFWDEIDVPDCSESGQRVSFDELFQEIDRDLAGEDADDVLNYRYLVLTNRYNAGVCDDVSLDRDRQSLAKMVNMLSIDPTITAPLQVDERGLIFRVDLRDYQWDRAITVNGENFNDVWEAIAGNNQYAVRFVGDDADDVVAETGTEFPFMYADSVADVATVGNLYYAITDVDVNQTLDDFIANILEIDVDANLDEEELIRAGTSDSILSRQDMVAERHEIEARSGFFWQRFDFADDQNESIYEDPFGFQEAGREAIYQLENGMMGYIIADANGVILEDSDILLDNSQNNFRVIAAVSCSRCHSAGLIAFEDQVRDVSLSNAIGFGFDADEVEALREVYPTAEEFKRQIDADTQTYQSALRRADLPVNGADPVAGVFLRFDLDMDLADAAGDLGLTPEQLETNIRELDPAVQVLENRVLDRDDFTQFFLNSLCILTVVEENTPDAQDCLDAQALVDGI